MGDQSLILWNESNLMDERTKFIARLRDDELKNMSALCREFGVPCKTGYKYSIDIPYNVRDITYIVRYRILLWRKGRATRA